MIKIKDLKVSFKDTIIEYRDTTFEANKITFIKGSNGTGKTTLLKAIAGLNEYQGTVESVGFVTFNRQDPVLFNMSVLKNIEYPLRIRKKDVLQYQQKINEYVKRFNIEHILNKNATLCSSGEKMKTSIIRSIIFSPGVLLLDEPTTSLDIESIKVLTDILKELKHEMTIIISSHDRLFIEELNDSIYELEDHNVQR